MLEVKNKNFAYLYCFPLNVEKEMTTLSEIKTFQLIWLKCCYEGNFNDVYITKRDRSRINLPRRSYIRGLELLEGLGLVTVNRGPGKANRITVNTEKLDKKSINSVLHKKNGEDQ